MENFLKVGRECRDLNVENVWYVATCSLSILRMLTCKLRFLTLPDLRGVEPTPPKVFPR